VTDGANNSSASNLIAIPFPVATEYFTALGFAIWDQTGTVMLHWGPVAAGGILVLAGGRLTYGVGAITLVEA
jgi:hypothetical protein